MARNKLTMRHIQEILRLKHQNQLSVRDIARSCCLPASTVGDYLKRAEEVSLICQPLRPWDQIPIFQGSQEKRYIEAFPVQHAREQCFGYRVLSVTKGLKFEFRNRGKEYYASLTPEQKAAIMEDRSVNKVLFSGDGMPLDSGSDSPLHCAETAFLDTTFMSSQDREGFNHGSLEEVAEACRNNHVKVAYAMHVSIRYQNDEIQKKLSEVAQVFPMRLIPNDRVVCLN